MQWWSAVGALGRFMMRAGAVILLFVAYQLWGTGLATMRAQNDLTRTFDALLAATPTTTPPSTPTTTATTPALAPTTTVATAPVDLPAPEPGGPVGRLSIPRIGVDKIIVQGVDLKWLQKGPGHFPQTPLPGQPGNSAIAGHRTTYDAPFNRIDELDPGDTITVTTVQGTFLYVVDAHPGERGMEGHRIVGPNDVSILDQGSSNKLTLMACNPKFSASQRIVVTATLTSPPAPPTPLPTDMGVTTDASIDALAGGDSSAWPAAMLLSAITIAAWFGVWFTARRWKRLPAYLLGTPVVLVLMFFAFEQIAKLLPASY